ncbi:MAG: hypothetical protein AAGC64_13920, partial [Bacteroidota bacterium]
NRAASSQTRNAEERLSVVLNYSQDLSTESYLQRAPTGRPKGLAPDREYVIINYLNTPGSIEESFVTDSPEEVSSEDGELEFRKKSAIPVLQVIRQANIDGEDELDLTSYGTQVLNSNLKIGEDDLRVVVYLEALNDKNVIHPNNFDIFDTDEAFSEKGEFRRIQLFNATRTTEASVKITTDKEDEQVLVDYLKLNDEDENVCMSGFCCTKCGRDLTIDQSRLMAIFPNSSLASGSDGSQYANLFNTALQTTSFNTCDRQAKLFAQIKHESDDFNATTEGKTSAGQEREWSLNKILTYFKRTSGAKRHWFNQDFWDDKEYKEFITINYYEEVNEDGTHISESTKDYYGVWNGQNQPQYHVEVPTGFKIDEDGSYKVYTVPSANKTQYRKNIFRYAYGGVLGNEDPDTNSNTEDGWKYRGKGAIQLTGKDNYDRNQNEIRKWFKISYDLVGNPDLVSDNLTVVVYSSVAFVMQNVLNIEDIDIMTIDEFSALVNTGDSNNSISNVNGGSERRDNYESLIDNDNLFKCDEE